MQYSLSKARGSAGFSIRLLLRATLIASLVFLLATASLVGCGLSTPTPQQQPSSPPADSGQSLSATDTITIDSYESDIFYDAGYEITMDGVRFPLPTTLNELGDDWRFEEDERKYFSYEDYYEGTDEVFRHTITLLYYKDRLMAMVSVKGFNIKNRRDAEIVAVYYGQSQKPEGYAEISCNGVSIGTPIAQLKELFQGMGSRITNERSDVYDIAVGDYYVTYQFYAHDAKNSNLPENDQGIITDLNIGLGYSLEPNGTHLPE
jgi:hypothetical protein